MQDYMDMLRNTFLCKGLTEEEFQYFVKHAGIQMKQYKKNEYIFQEMEQPTKLFLLVEGFISVYRVSMSGKIQSIADIVDPGDIFGEVYLYMQKPQYELNAVAKSDSIILTMHSQIFSVGEVELPTVYYKLMKNLLMMFAKKAYILNSKIQVLNSGSLRQRIVRYILNSSQKNGVVKLGLTREEMADFLNTTRPSLSRELGNMQKEGLIHIEGKKLKLLDIDKLDSYL